MIGGLGGAATNFINHPQANVSPEEIEPIVRIKEAPLDPAKSDEEESPRPAKEEWIPNFEFAVKCLAEESIRSADVLMLSKTAKYVSDNFNAFLRKAEDVHAFLEGTFIPAIDPKLPVPAYVLTKAHSALYKELGDLMRYLNACGKFDKYRSLLLTALFGSVPDNQNVILASCRPISRMESLKFSVMAQLYVPFCELTKNRQTERIEYYEMFYTLLEAKEAKINEIQKEYSIYAPSRYEIDWINRKILVPTVTFQSIIYLAEKYFKDLFHLAIDREMEARVVYLILKVLLNDKARLFHVPDHPSVFVLKDAMVDVNEEIVSPESPCADFLLSETSVQNHLSHFVEQVLLKSNAISLCFGRDECGIGGPENDFPIEMIKSYFLKELEKNPLDLMRKIKESPVIQKVLGKKDKLSKSDFAQFLRDEYERYNEAKTTSKGNFIIYRLNQICDGVEFNKRELKGLSAEAAAHAEFLFPFFLLQILLMTNDYFSDDFKRGYRSKKCLDGYSDKVIHEPAGLDAHKFTYRTDFFENSLTAYSVIGALSLSSFWEKGKLTMVLFKKITFSPFISFKTLSSLSENIFLEFNNDAFENEIVEQFNSLCSEINLDLIVKTKYLKERLFEIIFVKGILDDLKVSIHVYVDAMLALEPFEKPIREQKWLLRDPELSEYYFKIYGEYGFLRRGD